MANITRRSMTLNQKLRSLQFINLFVSIAGLYYYGAELFFVSYLIFIILCPIGISAGLHRYFTHKSFKTSKFWEKFMLFASVYATVGSSIAWVGIHRAHHLYADKHYDPHSPKDGIFKVWTGLGHTDTKIPVSFVKDLLRDPTHRFIHDNYFKILLIPVALLFLCDPILGIFLYSIPATLALQTTSIVNVLGHTHGYRTYDTDDRSTNSWIANLISLGEGWHNNHHKNPANYTIKEKSNEWDLISMFIRKIKQNQ